LQKKKQKNSYLLEDLATALPAPAVSRRFLVLFFKKELLAFCLFFFALPHPFAVTC